MSAQAAAAATTLAPYPTDIYRSTDHLAALIERYAKLGSSLRAAIDATPREMPLVFGTGGDPVASGIVTSLARPDGNATGGGSGRAGRGGDGASAPGRRATGSATPRRRDDPPQRHPAHHRPADGRERADHGPGHPHHRGRRDGAGGVGEAVPGAAAGPEGHPDAAASSAASARLRCASVFHGCPPS